MENINFYNVVEKNEEIQFYKRIPLKIIDYLKQNGRSTLVDLIKHVEGGDRRLLRLLNEMVLIKMIQFRHGYFYPLKKKKYQTKSIDVVCPCCKGEIIDDNKRFLHLKKLLKKIFLAKPKPTFIFDQRPVTLETTIKRALYLVWRGDIQTKRIAVIGDDDITSLALGFLNLAKEIVVFEIDKRLINFLKEQINRYHLNITVIERDILSGVPSKYRNRFDVFITDPTPTPAPFAAFINAGISLLKKEKDKVGYLSFYSSAIEKSIDLQKILTERDLLITDIIPFCIKYEAIKETYTSSDLKLFNKYSQFEPRIGFFESWVRLESTEKTQEKSLRLRLKDTLGRATKRILYDFKKDPVLGNIQQPDRSYLIKAVKKIIKRRNKKIIV